MRYHIDCSLIDKRNKSIHCGYERHDCRVLLDRTLVSESKKSSSRKSDALKFFNECSGPSNANNYYRDCLSIIEMENEDDPKFAKTLAEKFVGYILPYVVDVESVRESIDQYRIDPMLITMIDEASGSYKVCDRILDNHNKIGKRFNLESYIREHKNRPVKDTVLGCCKMIDTYGLKPHAKLNVCLEEMSYLFQKNGIKYDKSDLVKYSTEYFLTSHENTDIIDDNYRMVLSENSMITDTDLKSVSYFVEGVDNSRSIVDRNLHRITMEDNNQACINLVAMINDLFCDDSGRQDFVYNVSKVLSYTQDYLFNDCYDFDQVLETLDKIPQKIEACMSNNNWLLSREDLDAVIGQYEERIKFIDTDLSDNNDQETTSKLIKFKEYCTTTIARLNVIRGTVYPSYNVECMLSTSVLSESSTPMYLKEFKIFKFQNLVTAAFNLAKKDKKLGKDILNKIKPKKKKKGKNILDLAVEDVITSDGRADILVEEYDIIDNENFYEVQDYFSNLCESFNKTEMINKEPRAYYLVLGETVELHVTDGSHILGEDANIFGERDLELAIEVNDLADLCESIDIEALSEVHHSMMMNADKIGFDKAMCIVEASQYLGNIAKEDVDSFVYDVVNYSDTPLSMYESTKIKNLANSWVHEECFIDIQMEACNLIYACLESNDEDDEDEDDEKESKHNDNHNESKKDKKQIDKDKHNDKNKDKDKKDKKIKNPFAGIKLNDIKLALNGLKVKVKDLDSKYQNACKNIDMEASRLYNNMKSAMTSNRREAIIKGSIIPSFSKCIKWGIALCGAGLLTGNPAIPAIAAIGGMAVSKYLTKKERILLLDDIDVELEVMNKEIEIAERNDETKKLRELLRMRKDLERQKQRIKYNVRVGKDLLPGSATGVYNHNNGGSN